jgi:hypothetical protein
MLPIIPQYQSLIQLLSSRLFRIPEYQRAYSWTGEERQELFSDIKNTFAKGDDAEHFMATVVCLRRKKQTIGTDEFQVLEVVDGQQRLTTLIILVKAIRLALSTNDKAENKAIEEIDELLLKAGTDANAAALLLLQTNHDTTHYFSNYVRKGTIADPDVAKTIADQELLSAIAECLEFARVWKKTNGSLLPLWALLKNRLHFLLHEMQDERSVYSIFEVLNSRGLEVSWVDRLKSALMGKAFELNASNSDEVVKELHGTWKDVYACVGLRQGMSTEALRFAATLRSKSAESRPLGEEDAMIALRDQAVTAKAILDGAHWLLDVTKACDAIYANPRQQGATRIAPARLLAAAIGLRSDINEGDRGGLLRLWESLSFRIFGMLGNDSRKRVGVFTRLAWRVVNEKISANDIRAELRKIGADFPIEEAVKNLRATDCYNGWEPELRYFMFRYEEALAKGQKQKFSNEQWAKIWLTSPSNSIEHIWPQSKAPESSVHRLGNLVLLPPKLNSQLRDLAPKDKVERYRKTGLLIAGEVADMIESNKKWNGKVVAAREDNLLEWALTEWAD